MLLVQQSHLSILSTGLRGVREARTWVSSHIGISGYAEMQLWGVLPTLDFEYKYINLEGKICCDLFLFLNPQKMLNKSGSWHFNYLVVLDIYWKHLMIWKAVTVFLAVYESWLIFNTVFLWWNQHYFSLHRLFTCQSEQTFHQMIASLFISLLVEIIHCWAIR